MRKRKAKAFAASPNNIKNKQNKMFAIVEIKGQQFRVEKGQKLYVNLLNDAKEGDKVEFDKVLLIGGDGNVSVGEPTVKGAKVVAEVGGEVKGEKVLVFHKKRRKGYRKLNGHREHYTEITINEIVA